MAKIIEDDFTKELSDLFTIYKKRIDSDKNGIYIVDNINPVRFLLRKPTSGIDDHRDVLITVI